MSFLGFGKAPTNPTPVASNPEPAPNAGPVAVPIPGSPNPAPEIPGQSRTPAAATPTPTPAAPTLWQALMQQNGADDTPLTPEMRASQFVSTILNAPQADPTANAAPALNTERVMEMLPNMNLGAGMDYGELLEAMSGENGQETFAKFMATSQQNTIGAIIPLVNALVQQSMTQSQSQAVQQSHQDLTSSSIISAFNQTHPYGNSDAIKPMLEGFAKTLAESAPRGAHVSDMVAQLHQVFSGLGSTISGGSEGASHQRAGNGQQNMSDLFKPRS